jgi:PAS domain S-box-containing protein
MSQPGLPSDLTRSPAPGDHEGHQPTRADWQSFIDNVQDYAIFMLDAGGRVATWNRGAERFKGYPAPEIIGRHFSTFYTEPDLAIGKPERELEDARRHGRVEDEGWRVRKDGTTFWANVIITALFDDSGAVTGYAKVTRDLSTRRAAEEELRRSEERFRLLVDSVQDYAMYMLDPSGVVTTWNSGAEKLKGYTPFEIIGRHFSLFFPAEDVQAGKPERELHTARTVGRFEEEAYRVRKDGTLFWANVTLTPVRDADGTLLGYAKVTRDLTARIAAERTARDLVREQVARSVAESAEARVREAFALARDAAQRAEEANRFKEEFLATVSHELRTPLNAIVGWSSLLRSRTSDEAVLRGVDVIQRNALAQGRIIEDILDVSRIITGKLHLDLQSTDLAAVVREALEVVRPAAMAKDLRLEFVPPPGECSLIADAERLRQVVWNLLSNAAKFGNPGGTVHVSIESTSRHYVLTVSDDGKGIEPQFLPYVFDRFKQADSSMTRRVGGLGLGLSIVRHLVELHGGQVEASSLGLNLGATFRVTLPIRAVQSGVADAHAALDRKVEGPAPCRADILAHKRVLVVDDDDDSRELLETALIAAGAQVETAPSAALGFVALTRFRPHVLISDIGMPDEDGYSLLRRVRALEPGLGGDVPAIALTAYTRTEDKALALAAGFATHVSKPAHPGELIAAVVALLPMEPN